MPNIKWVGEKCGINENVLMADIAMELHNVDKSLDNDKMVVELTAFGTLNQQLKITIKTKGGDFIHEYTKDCCSFLHGSI